MADEIEGTIDKLKAGAKVVAKKVTDPSKDLGDEYDKERGKENSTGYERTTGSGTSDPMSPEKIASNEPTAVRRDSSQGTAETSSRDKPSVKAQTDALNQIHTVCCTSVASQTSVAGQSHMLRLIQT